MSRFTFELAQASDDLLLQELFSGEPMGGDIQIVFQRKPSYFHVANLGYPVNQIIVVRDKIKNCLAGCGSRSTRLMYVNGEVLSSGYLSSLRIKKEYRSQGLLARGYRYLKDLHRDGKTPLYVTTIIDKNAFAKGLLLSGRCGLPAYRDFGLYRVMAINLSRRKKMAATGIKFIRGSLENLPQIIDCLNRNGAKRQFYPCCRKEDFISSTGIFRDLSLADFYLALENQRVIGVMAGWKQENFKQTVIAGYGRKLAMLRPFYNLGAKFLGYPYLPAINSQLNLVYAGFIAIESDDLDIFRALLDRLYSDLADSKYQYLLVGLHEKDPLFAVLKEYRYLEYDTRLFVVYWQDGKDTFKDLDQRIPYLELGML